MPKKVVLGISGGVDSAVSALLLQQQGYTVIGMFMRNWEETDSEGNCSAEADYKDAVNVCRQLNIDYYSVNFSKQYLDKVFSYFLEEYALGRTPNPDVLCNREIKFGPFLDYANALGADYIATGHYCGIEHVNGVHYLKKALDTDKDQTYFLNQLNQRQLEKVLFPLANLTKPQVRELAKQYNLPVAEKKDSTGICFIGERNFRQFLSGYFPAQKGDIVDVSGRKVGEHCGLMYYTLGQRKGLGIGGIAGDDVAGRWFVSAKDMAHNRLIVSHGDESVLYSRSCVCSTLNFIPPVVRAQEFSCTAKFRYRQAEQQVTVRLTGETSCQVLFNQPQRAVTEGQFAVFYDNDYCIGGGVIEKVTK